MTQIARPTSLTTDEWTGAYTALADASDATYIQSPVLPVESQTFLCPLSEVNPPGATTGHQLRVRSNVYPSLATSQDLVLEVENADDASVVATRTITTVPDEVGEELWTLTEAEVGNIHSYSGLRVRGRGRTTTSGTLTLASTFDCISVTATFDNDTHGSETATIQYKASASGTWLDAYAPMIDRRATIEGSANPYIHQFRGSIVGLSAGTSYDVRVTLSTGGTLYGAVTTISATVPGLTGTDRYATNDATLATALGDAQPGDTIHLAAGTYSPFTVSVSGTAANWIALIGDDRDTTYVDGGTTDITVNGNYVQLKNLRLKKPTTSGTTQGICLNVGSGRHHVWIDNLHFEDLPLPGGGASYGNTTINLAGSNYHVYVLNSLFKAPSLASKPDQDSGVGGFGVQTGALASSGTVIIKGNTFDGKFQDPIGSTESYGYNQWNNSDIANNTISGYSDDGIQAEGDAVNVRIFGNTVTCDHGYSAIAQQSSYVGPSYIFRNLLISTKVGATGIFKVGGAAFSYYFHNTFDAIAGTGTIVWSGGGNGQVSRNNIVKTNTSSIIDFMYAGDATKGTPITDLDYDLWYQTSQNAAYRWNGTTTYDTYASFQAGTGMETHRVVGDPMFLNAAREIDATSPAYNVGVTLANFNTATSAWPAFGAGPDLGYYEVGSP